MCSLPEVHKANAYPGCRTRPFASVFYFRHNSDGFPVVYLSPFVTCLARITIHIHAVSQCLVSYGVERTVVRSDYKLLILRLFKIEVLFGLLLKPLLRYISRPRVDNKCLNNVEKLLLIHVYQPHMHH